MAITYDKSKPVTPEANKQDQATFSTASFSRANLFDAETLPQRLSAARSDLSRNSDPATSPELTRVRGTDSVPFTTVISASGRMSGPSFGHSADQEDSLVATEMTSPLVRFKSGVSVRGSNPNSVQVETQHAISIPVVINYVPGTKQGLN
jgi:hypothetical protein